MPVDAGCLKRVLTACHGDADRVCYIFVQFHLEKNRVACNQIFHRISHKSTEALLDQPHKTKSKFSLKSHPLVSVRNAAALLLLQELRNPVCLTSSGIIQFKGL